MRCNNMREKAMLSLMVNSQYAPYLKRIILESILYFTYRS